MYRNCMLTYQQTLEKYIIYIYNEMNSKKCIKHRVNSNLPFTFDNDQRSLKVFGKMFP